MSLYTSLFVYADYATPWQTGFQEPATSNMQGIVDLHHDIVFFMITILAIVVFVGYRIYTGFSASSVSDGARAERFTHNTTIELVWSLAPSVVVLMIALPSLTLIYSLDDIVDHPSLTVKILGRQWYWTYEYRDLLVQQ